MNNGVYLDNAAAMMPSADILRFYAGIGREFFANAEAIHPLAYRLRNELKCAARRLSSALLGAECPVIWGESATELFRLIASCPAFGDSCASALEHPALTANLKHFTKLKQLPVSRSGAVQLPDGESFALAAFYQVQSELGIIQDTAGLFSGCRAGFRLVDSVQAAGKLPLDRAADGWIISGVKFGAPGGAALLLAPGGKYTDTLLKHSEEYRHKDYALSRINVPQVLTMVQALETAESMREENFRKISALNTFIRDSLENEGILATLPGNIPASPYILNMLLPEQESAVVVRALGAAGVYIASGSACSAESGKPSEALTALGFRAAQAYRAIRISFGFSSDERDGEIFLSELKKVLKNY